MNEKNRQVYKKSNYKHVAIYLAHNTTRYVLTFKGVGRDSFASEREAALAADKYLIGQGKEPVNILKRVK